MRNRSLKLRQTHTENGIFCLVLCESLKKQRECRARTAMVREFSVCLRPRRFEDEFLVVVNEFLRDLLEIQSNGREHWPHTDVFPPSTNQSKDIHSAVNSKKGFRKM